MSTQHHVIVKLEPKPDTAKGWLAKGKAVTGAATAAGPTFASVAALLNQAVADTTALDQAESKAANKGHVEITGRNAAWRVQQKSLRALVAGVQGLCDGAPDVAHAQNIAASSSLDTKLTAVRVAADPKVKVLGGGAVRVYGRRPVARRDGAWFEWQMSSNGGQTWVSIAGTNGAKTLVQGLTTASTMLFRYRTTFKNVVSEWKQSSGILVS